MEAASRLNYRPNAAARALAGCKTQTLGVAAQLRAGGANSAFHEILAGILDAALQNQQHVCVFPIDDWDSDIAKINRCCDGHIDGMILINPTIPEEKHTLLPRHTPLIAIHPSIALPGIQSVDCNDELAAFELVRELQSMGHRHILHLSGPAKHVDSLRRAQGWRRALESLGTKPSDTLLIESDLTAAGARSALKRWLAERETGPLPDAIFCANDAMALAAITLFQQNGLRIPEDLSICGFGDSLEGQTSQPRLSTVRLPFREMGVRAVESLLGRVQEGLEHALPALGAPLSCHSQLVMRASATPSLRQAQPDLGADIS